MSKIPIKSMLSASCNKKILHEQHIHNQRTTEIYLYFR
nr:MAG TPA: hypothetical protein [Caudoviricetes sp.]